MRSIKVKPSHAQLEIVSHSNGQRREVCVLWTQPEGLATRSWVVKRADERERKRRRLQSPKAPPTRSQKLYPTPVGERGRSPP